MASQNVRASFQFTIVTGYSGVGVQGGCCCSGGAGGLVARYMPTVTSVAIMSNGREIVTGWRGCSSASQRVSLGTQPI
jgi:hypothetical protein